MADAKPRKTRQVALGTTALVALVWLLGVWPPPVWWRTHWPRETALMREADCRAEGQRRSACPAVRRIALAQIACVVENDRGLYLAAMHQRACAEPHRGPDQQEQEEFSHHRCTVNSRLAIRILHSFVFVLKTALHSPPPRWN